MAVRFVNGEVEVGDLASSQESSGGTARNGLASPRLESLCHRVVPTRVDDEKLLHLLTFILSVLTGALFSKVANGLCILNITPCLEA